MSLKGAIRDDAPMVGCDARGGELRLSTRGSVALTVDTGFTGALAVPASLARQLRLDYAGVETFALATGDVVELAVYLGTARVGRRRLDTWFIIGDALVGMEFLSQACSALHVDFERHAVQLLTR